MRYDSSIYTDLTDEELIQRVQSGDEAAFAQLASRHSSRIWQMVVSHSRQTRDAEEIFQDIWVAVWENIGGLREIGSFGAWLRKIAYTTCRRYYAAKSHNRGEILQSAEKLAETIDRDVLARTREMELRTAVTEAVHHLPERVRAVAVLYYLELWTVNEIAEELGLAAGTVKTRLRQIRALLRQEFGIEAHHKPVSNINAKEALIMNSSCGCSDNSQTKEIVRLSPRDEEQISLPHVFQWEPIDDAHAYVLRINEVRDTEATCIKETKDPKVRLKETDLDVGENYLWHLEGLDDTGRTIATTKGGCGTPIATFAVESTVEDTPTTDRRILLDFSHNQSNIRGLGVYGFSQYTAYALLRKNGFEVGTNVDRNLSEDLLSGYDVLVLHSKYAGPIVPFIPSEIQAITDYVANGGSLFVLCWGSGGCVDGPDFYNPLLKEFNIELKPIPDPEFRKAENLAAEIFRNVNEIALQCPAEIVGNGYDVLGCAPTGEDLLVKADYGEGAVFVSGMGMAFQDTYMGGKDERAINNQQAFVNLMKAF